MASAARTQAACFQSAIAELKALPLVGLKELIERAAEAQDAMRANLARIDTEEWSDAHQDVQDRLDDKFDEARRALVDHLLFEHRVGSALADRMGEIL